MLRRFNPFMLLGVVEGVLLARLVALLFAARPDNTMVGAVLALSAPVVWPFGGLDRWAGQPLYGARLELATVAAMAATLLAALIAAAWAPRRMEKNNA